MSIVKWQREENNVAIITMDNCKNLHNPAFAEAMLSTLDEVEADSKVNAVILSSSDEKNWSQGIDIQWIMTAVADKKSRETVREFLWKLDDIFKRLLLFPVPVICAINGHAFGNGAIMSCACDFRFMVKDRGFFCFPEVDVNIPFLLGMLAIVKKAVPYQKLNEMMLMGKRLGGVEAYEHHIVEQITEDTDKLMEASMDYALKFQKNRAIFREMKRRTNQHIIDTIDNDDAQYIDTIKLFCTD